MRRTFLLVVLAIPIAAELTYQKPAQEILDILNAPVPPVLGVNPPRTHATLPGSGFDAGSPDSLPLRPHDRRRNVLHLFGIAVRGTVPDGTAIRTDINHAGILGIGEDSLAPLEVVSGDATPRFTPIDGLPDRRFEARRVQHTRLPRIDCNVKNMLIFFKHVLPTLAGIG
jgi:hypothetical protein